MDWKALLEILSPITIIFVAGAMSQQLKDVREEVKEFRQISKEWGALRVRLEQVERVQGKNTSDIRSLLRDLGKTREEMISIHDHDQE